MLHKKVIKNDNSKKSPTSIYSNRSFNFFFKHPSIYEWFVSSKKKNKLKYKKPFFEGNYFYSLVNGSWLWKPNSLTSVLLLNFHSMKEGLINTANGESRASFPGTKSHLQLKLLQQQILWRCQPQIYFPFYW